MVWRPSGGKGGAERAKRVTQPGGWEWLEQVSGLAPGQKRKGLAAFRLPIFLNHALAGREIHVNEKQLFVYRETARAIERAGGRQLS